MYYYIPEYSSGCICCLHVCSQGIGIGKHIGVFFPECDYFLVHYRFLYKAEALWGFPVYFIMSMVVVLVQFMFGQSSWQDIMGVTLALLGDIVSQNTL